jgi:hypothetical protein
MDLIGNFCFPTMNPFGLGVSHNFRASIDRVNFDKCSLKIANTTKTSVKYHLWRRQDSIAAFAITSSSSLNHTIDPRNKKSSVGAIRADLDRRKDLA